MAWMQRIMFMARKWLMVAGILVMPAVVPSSARAAGTASGTPVSNSVLLQCSLCGAGGITSAAAPFVVDNKVNVSVTDGDGAATSAVAGQASAVSAFTISNLGNTVQDYSLTAANIASGAALFGGTDNFDAAACMVRVESGATPGYDAADTATFIDELVPDASRTVYVVCNIAASQAGGDLAIVSLAAATLQGGTPGMQGGATAATIGVDTPATVDIVFVDAVGSDDTGRDGRHSARGAYLLGTPVTLSKTIANIQDPSGCSAASGCKVVRGAILTYRIELVVPGAGNVSGLVLTDPIPADMTYVPDSIVVNGAAKTDAADGDQADFGITSANTVTVSPGSVSAPLTIWFTFRTTIN
jgi:uncharacterized repeat protein (TIGR01451 family)